jgi:hypothetical protein
MANTSELSCTSQQKHQKPEKHGMIININIYTLEVYILCTEST